MPATNRLKQKFVIETDLVLWILILLVLFMCSAKVLHYKLTLAAIWGWHTKLKAETKVPKVIQSPC